MSDDRPRIKIFVYLACFGALLICFRLGYLQIYKGDFHSKNAKEQAVNDVKITKGRGFIYDRDGKPLALNRKTMSLYVFGKHIKNRKKFIKDIKNSGVKISEATEKALKTSDNFIWIERNLDPDLAEMVMRKVPGVYAKATESRIYPQRFIAAPLIGFTGDYGKGRWGLEYLYEDFLKGEEIKLSFMADSSGRSIALEDRDAERIKVSELHLTIDTYMQWLAKTLMDEGAAEFGAERGIALGMDVHTGEILFAASSGGFDSNKYRDYSNAEWQNFAGNYLFEPGSIMKPVIFTKLLDKKLIRLNKWIECENGKFMMYGHEFSDVHPYKSLTTEQVIVKSSNIGIIKLSELLEKKEFYEYMAKLGFGEKTGTEGFSDQKGMLRHYKKWSGMSRASLSMGQELLVTPIQVLRFYAAVANGGNLPKPLFVLKKRDKFSEETNNPVFDRVMSEDTAAVMRDVLRKVVTEGTGANANSSYVEIAGKTGTGQRFDNKTGKYSTDAYFASFAGFFPADKPQIAMVVIYDSPKKSIYGGSTAAHTFKKLAELISIKMGYKRVWTDESLSAS